VQNLPESGRDRFLPGGSASMCARKEASQGKIKGMALCGTEGIFKGRVRAPADENFPSIKVAKQLPGRSFPVRACIDVQNG
jgi:hypothetical protein